MRLRQSSPATFVWVLLDRQDLLSEVLTLTYGKRLAGLVMMIGLAMATTGRMSRMLGFDAGGRVKSWRKNALNRDSTDDPNIFDEALEAANTVLNAARPQGVKRVAGTRPYTGRWLARELISDLGSRHNDRNLSSLELLSGDTRALRSLLGPIAARMVKAVEASPISGENAAPQDTAAWRPTQAEIAAAADAVLDLVNSSPRTPSRQEIAEAIDKHLMGQSAKRGAG